MGSYSRICGKCDDDYDQYTVIVPNEPGAIATHREIQDRYGNVCKDCRAEFAPRHAW